MAAPKDRFRLGDMTSSAFAAMATAKPVILLPLGSHEDHGPHLPMGDYLLADALAINIAAAATAAGAPCLIAPTLPFGVADHFGASPGGLAISPANFRGVLADLLSSLLRHGLTKILILNGHGGNAPVIHEVTLSIRNSQNIIIPSFYLWKIARSLMEARLGPGHAARFGHGAEPLLSLSRALRPDDFSAASVPPPQPALCLGLPVTDFGTLTFENTAVDAPVEFAHVPRPAIAAALHLASAELGHAVAADLVAKAAHFVCHFSMVASASGVSKSRNTDSVSTATSATDSM